MSDLSIESRHLCARELVANAAHASWCNRMLKSGWRHGTSFDEQSKVHDALVEYNALDLRDRRAILIAIEAESFESRLADTIHYQRGPAREILLEDVRMGLRVGWNREAFDEVEEIDLDEFGVIVDWETEVDGVELRSIEVLWDSGHSSTHHPCEQELLRIERECG